MSLSIRLRAFVANYSPSSNVLPVKLIITSCLCSVILSSCASSLPYGVDYPLTDHTFRSRDGVFAGKVPKGWFSSSGDTVVPALVAWLIKEDVSAAMTVRELSLDDLTLRRVEKDGLMLLARIGAGLHQSAAGKLEPKEFEMGGKRFCSYEVTDGGKRTRIVVFGAKGKYYECEAAPKNSGNEEVVRTFTAQQTFLSSLTF